MQLNDYQSLAQRTANKSDYFTRLAIAGLGLTGEAGEVAEHIKKAVGHGHDLSVDDVKKELGDVLWYIAEVASIVNLSLDEIAQANIEKLRKRYPEGFSEIASQKRVDVE